MKELKTYRDVLQALLDGVEVEFKNSLTDTWVTLNSMFCDFIELDYNVRREFRIKPTKPSIDWSHVSEELNYLARDKSGQVHLFEHEPRYSQNVWICGSGRIFLADTFISLKEGNCDAEDSLVERPTE